MEGKPPIAGKIVDGIYALESVSVGKQLVKEKRPIAKFVAEKSGSYNFNGQTFVLAPGDVICAGYEEVEVERTVWEYQPCAWPIYGPERVRIAFQDGTYLDFHGTGYECDGLEFTFKTP